MLGNHQPVVPEILCKCVRDSLNHLLTGHAYIIATNSITDPRDGADDSIPDTTPVRDSMS